MVQKSALFFGVLLLSVLLLSGCCQLAKDFGSGFQEGYGKNVSIPNVIPQVNPPGGSAWGGGREWTYIVFMNGDNNLEGDSVSDFLEMEGVGSTDRIAVVIQEDRSGKYFTQDKGAWAGARRFLLEKGDGQAIRSTPLKDLGNTDMSKADTLANFVEWAVDKYPAKHYALVLWDHGGGWTGMSQDETSGSSMTMQEFRKGLRQITGKLGKKIDVIVFDMCLMAQYDVLLETAPYADYAAGSEEVVPGYSFNYTSLLTKLNAEPGGLTPRRLAELEVEDFGAFYRDRDDATTFSAMDLLKVPALEKAFEDFIGALSPKMQKDWKSVADMQRFTEYYAIGTGQEQIWSFTDLYDFARVSSAYSPDDANLQSKALALQKAINATVIADYHHRLHPKSYGISYYFQPSKKLYRNYQEQNYLNTTAYSKPVWKNFLAAYYARENMADASPAIDEFKVSAAASLARPVHFSYKMSGSSIVKNQWAQFYKENGGWKLARLISQRSMTRLPDGSEAYGFSDGSAYGRGNSMPVEFGISDGTKTVKASVEQRWPAEDFFVANGRIRKRSGSEFEAQIFFAPEHGYAAKALGIAQDNDGKQYLSPVAVDDGDVFIPYVYKMGANGLVPEQGEAITYTNANGLQLSWQPLQAGDYMVADILTDLEGKMGLATGQFSVKRQPVITAPAEQDFVNDWNCGVMSSGLTVGKIMSLSLGNNRCLFQDSTGTYNCTFYYSQAGAPHIYIHNVETKENFKFLVSERDKKTLWLYELAGTDPIICIAKGSAAPTVGDYRELYQSIGDSTNDIDEVQAGAGAVVGTWEDTAGGMELKLNQDGSFQWKIGKSTVSGRYRISGYELYLDASSPSAQYSTVFTYACGKKRMLLYDPSMNEISLVKEGADVSVSNEPVAQTGQSTPQGGQTNPPNPPQTVPTSLAGVWVNNDALMTLWLKPDNTYEFSSGYSYAVGTYTVSGDSITFMNYYTGAVDRYTYRLNGNSVSFTNNAGTLTFSKYQ